MKLKPSWKRKSLIVFDLDGTLVRTKSPMDPEMVVLVRDLLAVKKVAIIGGGKYPVFRSLLLARLGRARKLFRNLSLFPTTATAFYRYERGWKRVYARALTRSQRARIKKMFQRVFDDIGYVHPKRTYGMLIEDRTTQVTFSVYGQDIVKVLGARGVRIKEEWAKKNAAMKMKIARLLQAYLPDLEVRAAGFTSIDVTQKGIDKAYGLRQIERRLRTRIRDMLFVGDAIYPGGNDYAVVRTGVDYVKVNGPEDTKKIIRALLKSKSA